MASSNVALAYCGGCALLSWLWFQVLPKKKSFPERFEWAVRCAETMNAISISVGSAYWLLFSAPPIADIEDLGWFRYVVDAMLGYLCFDTIYEMILPVVKNTKPGYAFIAHHIVGIVSHLLARKHKLISAYAAYIYLAEASTPFLHFSWMCNLLDSTDSSFFFINGTIGALCYLIFRVIIPPLTLLHMLASRHLFESYALWYPWSFRLLIFSQTFFLLLNLHWFVQLIALVQSKLPKKEKEM